MSSEIIVVLILMAVAFGFIVWVRLNSKEHEAPKSPEIRVESRESGESR